MSVEEDVEQLRHFVVCDQRYEEARQALVQQGGYLLKRIREAHGMAQYEMAEAAGVNASYYKRVEEGRMPITPHVATLVLDYVDILEAAK